MSTTNTTSKFDKAIKIVLEHEGSKLAKDGSRFGIGYNTAAMFNIPEPEKFIRNLNPEKAAAFYRQHYWDSLYEQIPSQQVATKVFDLGVVMGMGTAVKLLQASLNEHGANLAIDGVFGPKTLAKVKAIDQERLLATYAAKAVNKMKSFKEAGEYPGWIARARWPFEVLNEPQKQQV